MDIRFAKSSVVLKLSSSDGWAVVGDKDEFGSSVSHALDGVSVSNLEFTRFDNQIELDVDVGVGLVLLVHLYN